MKHYASVAMLEKCGWEFDHEALHFGYKYAGACSDMATRKGYHHIRVHVGQCYHKGAYTYQLTLVFRKKVN